MATTWTPERRARQAALIRTWKPWARASGPRTPEGKAKASRNATKHGGRSAQTLEQLREIRTLLAECRQRLR